MIVFKPLKHKYSIIGLVFLSLIVFLTTISQASATDIYITRPKNTLINVVIPCSFNGGSCTSDTACNISIWYPNNSIFTAKEPMTKINDSFNYTYTNTSISGDYKNYMICCNSEACKDVAFLVRIGSPFSTNLCPSNTDDILIFIFLFVLIITFLILAIIMSLGWLGLLSAIALLIYSWVFIGCSALIGMILLLMSLMFILYFVLQKWW